MNEEEADVFFSGNFKMFVNRNIIQVYGCDLLQPIYANLIGVFGNAHRNEVIAQHLVQEGFLQLHEKVNTLDPHINVPNTWGNHLVKLILGGQIPETLLALCNPNITRVSAYSKQIQNLLNSIDGVLVTETRLGEWMPKKLPKKYFLHFVIAIGAILCVLFVLEMAGATSLFHSKTQSPNLTELVSKSRFVEEKLKLFIISSHLPSKAEVDLSSSSNDGSIKDVDIPIRPQPCPAPNAEMFVRLTYFDLPAVSSCHEYATKSYQICGERNSFTRVTLNGKDPYSFNHCHMNCGDVIDSLVFLNSNIHVADLVTILLHVRNLTYIEFNGGKMCVHDQSLSTLQEISMIQFEQISFVNLQTENGYADCIGLYFWLASYKVKHLSTKRLSFENVTFTESNKWHVHQIIKKAFLDSTSYKRLEMTNVHFYTEMFDQVMQPLVHIPVVILKFNSQTEHARRSVFNFLNNFVNLLTIDKLTIDSYFSDKNFQDFIQILGTSRVRELEMPMIINKPCDNLNFSFIQKIAWKINRINLKLTFSEDCLNYAKYYGVVLEGLNHLVDDSTDFKLPYFQLTFFEKFHLIGRQHLKCREPKVDLSTNSITFEMSKYCQFIRKIQTCP